MRAAAVLAAPRARPRFVLTLWRKGAPPRRRYFANFDQAKAAQLAACSWFTVRGEPVAVELDEVST